MGVQFNRGIQNLQNDFQALNKVQSNNPPTATGAASTLEDVLSDHQLTRTEYLELIQKYFGEDAVKDGKIQLSDAQVDLFNAKLGDALDGKIDNQAQLQTAEAFEAYASHDDEANAVNFSLRFKPKTDQNPGYQSVERTTFVKAIHRLRDAQPAPEGVNGDTRGALDPANPNDADKKQRLMYSIQSLVPTSPGTGMSMVSAPADSFTASGGVALTALNNVTTGNEVMPAMRTALRGNADLMASLGGNPSDAQLDQYMVNNADQILQDLGRQMSESYEGYIAMPGDVANASQILENEGKGVCTDIHLGLNMLREKLTGEKTFTVYTSGSDASHMFNIFQDKESGNWHIQNYGDVFETNAKSPYELYAKFLPNQTHITLYDVDDSGNVKQTRDVMTPYGLQRERFMGQMGTGNYDPTQAQNGIELGTNGLGYTAGDDSGRFHLRADPAKLTFAGNYHWQHSEGTQRTVEGVAVEIKGDNPNTGQSAVFQAKYEHGTTDIDNNGQRTVVTTTYAGAHIGVEKDPGNPHWAGSGDGATPADVDATANLFFGGRFSMSQLMYNNSIFSPEVGWSTNIGGTGTTALGDGHFVAYAGRMVHDLRLDASGQFGLRVQSEDFLMRAGLKQNVDLTRVDGFGESASAAEQIDNVMDTNYYAQMILTPGGGPLTLFSSIDGNLFMPEIYTITAGAEYKDDTTSFSTVYVHQHDPEIYGEGGLNSGRANLGIDLMPELNLAGGIGVSDLGGGDVSGNMLLTFRPGASDVDD